MISSGRHNSTSYNSLCQEKDTICTFQDDVIALFWEDFQIASISRTGTLYVGVQQMKERDSCQRD